MQGSLGISIGPPEDVQKREFEAGEQVPTFVCAGYGSDRGVGHLGRGGCGGGEVWKSGRDMVDV